MFEELALLARRFQHCVKLSSSKTSTSVAISQVVKQIIRVRTGTSSAQEWQNGSFREPLIVSLIAHGQITVPCIAQVLRAPRDFFFHVEISRRASAPLLCSDFAVSLVSPSYSSFEIGGGFSRRMPFRRLCARYYSKTGLPTIVFIAKRAETSCA